MLWVAAREKEGWIDPQSMKKFPCTDLRTIDQLWVKYSNGKFGFSVQRRIWQEVGQDWDKFGQRTGWLLNNKWLNYDDLTFELRAPAGHLPARRVGGAEGFKNLWNIFSPRRDACKL